MPLSELILKSALRMAMPGAEVDTEGTSNGEETSRDPNGGNEMHNKGPPTSHGRDSSYQGHNETRPSDYRKSGWRLIDSLPRESLLRNNYTPKGYIYAPKCNINHHFADEGGGLCDRPFLFGEDF